MGARRATDRLIMRPELWTILTAVAAIDPVLATRLAAEHALEALQSLNTAASPVGAAAVKASLEDLEC